MKPASARWRFPPTAATPGTRRMVSIIPCRRRYARSGNMYGATRRKASTQSRCAPPMARAKCRLPRPQANGPTAPPAITKSPSKSPKVCHIYGRLDLLRRKELQAGNRPGNHVFLNLDQVGICRSHPQNRKDVFAASERRHGDGPVMASEAAVEALLDRR